MPKSKSVAHSHQEIVELLVAGTWENAEAARLLLLVAIDTLQPGIVSEKMQVELRYQNMIGGRKRQELQDLMARTRTNIYMTSPFVQTANKGGSPVDPRYNDIYITGEASQVQIAKETLTRAYSRARSESVSCTRQVNIATRKLEWMLLNHREKLRAIMLDNASFIAFPPLGATHPIIFVYGETRVNVERTIRMVMQLVSYKPILAYFILEYSFMLMCAICSAIDACFFTLLVHHLVLPIPLWIDHNAGTYPGQHVAHARLQRTFTHRQRFETRIAGIRSRGGIPQQQLLHFR